MVIDEVGVIVLPFVRAEPPDVTVITGSVSSEAGGVAAVVNEKV